MRDDFNNSTKIMLARRVGYRCSNPDCIKPTSGPSTDLTKAINIGVAAHITAASPGGARYDPQLTSEQRSSIDNGVWLCQNCAKLVDNDQERYSADLLRTWKTEAEERALQEIESSNFVGRARAGGASLVLQIGTPVKPIPTARDGWINLRLNVSITSDNGISSESGALKLTIARPLMFSKSTEGVFRSAHFNTETGLKLDNFDDIPHADSVTIRWGTNVGIVIFPGDWYDFFGNPIVLNVPALLPDPTYLIQAELFSIDASSRKALFSIHQKAGEDLFEVRQVTRADFEKITTSFWQTYHLAREKP